ncbi:hypothetical protein Tco_0787788 [Tanacetum coccineum]
MHENKFFNRNPANHALYHALMEALIEDENVMDKGVADTIKNHKQQNDDDEDEDPPTGPNQGKKTKRRRTKELKESSKKTSTTRETPKGKAPSKGSKTGKSTSTKEPVKEPIAEVAMDDAVNTMGKEVVRDNDRPQDTSEPVLYKSHLIKDLFKQPPRPPSPDLRVKLYLINLNSLEIVVKRADRQLYKFKEGDFIDLLLNDIKDILLLAIQHKLFHINDGEIVEFIVALFDGGLMRMYKFRKGPLKKVQDELHQRILDFRLGYNKGMSRRKWTAIDKRRSDFMVELIYKQMREIWDIRILKMKLVGDRNSRWTTKFDDK